MYDPEKIWKVGEKCKVHGRTAKVLHESSDGFLVQFTTDKTSGLFDHVDLHTFHDSATEALLHRLKRLPLNDAGELETTYAELAETLEVGMSPLMKHMHRLMDSDKIRRVWTGQTGQSKSRYIFPR